MYSFVVFKYVTLNLGKKKNTFQRELAYIFWICGEAEIILEIWGAKANYFQGAEDSFQGFGAINALFVGSNDPLGPLKNIIRANLTMPTSQMIHAIWSKVIGLLVAQRRFLKRGHHTMFLVMCDLDTVPYILHMKFEFNPL